MGTVVGTVGSVVGTVGMVVGTVGMVVGTVGMVVGTVGMVVGTVGMVDKVGTVGAVGNGMVVGAVGKVDVPGTMGKVDVLGIIEVEDPASEEEEPSGNVTGLDEVDCILLPKPGVDGEEESCVILLATAHSKISRHPKKQINPISSFRIPGADIKLYLLYK